MKERIDAMKARLSSIRKGPAASVALVAVALAIFWLKGPSSGTHPFWERTRDRLSGKGGDDKEPPADEDPGT